MTDRELLLLAAEAGGYDAAIEMYGFSDIGEPLLDANDPPTVWNPLTDDGDALRLAVRLRMDVETWIHGDSEWARVGCQEALVDEPHGNDPGRATRRAIVRAAACIGNGMDAPE
jgi:hypothetical protein